MPLEENRPCCRALYDFRGEYPGELSFSANELIYLSHRVNAEWYHGKSSKTNKEGIFPETFIEILVPLSDDKKIKKTEENLPSCLAEECNVPIIGVASVLYDFEARYPDELTVMAGDSIQILTLEDVEWAKCRDPTNNRVGIVPQSFLHIFLEPIDNNSSEISNNQSGSSWFSTFNTQLDVHKSSNPSSKWSWPDSAWNGENLLARKSSAPNLAAPPPRPPPPKLETTCISITKPSSKYEAATRPKSLVFPNVVNWRANTAIEPAHEAEENTTTTSSISMENPHIRLDIAAASQSDAKTKILLDLLNTEKIYLFDLETWESCIKHSSQLNAEDKKALTNGYFELKNLSQTLISALTAQKDLPVGDQALGEVFINHKDQFFSAFAHHFRCVEQIGAILENETDSSLQQALQNCVVEMRSRGSNVFDVATAISRPIQRCLKYPLYMDELMKNTPINHPDHPKLMESLKQLGLLASKMNECKRRKELVRKYKDQEQLSLGDRIARINMHSLVKKSNRLKYRINRTMGFGTVKDSEFDYLVHLLEESERRLCKFLYCVQLYRKHMDITIKRHEDSYKGACQVQDEQIVKAFAHMFRTVDDIYRPFINCFENEIIKEGRKLVRSELAKLIHKRLDKMADFETAKVNSKNFDEVEMRRNEFEALNNQIKAQLPRVISGINKNVLKLVQRVNELHQQFMHKMDEWHKEGRPEKVRHCAPLTPSFRAHIPISLKNTLVEMDKIAAQIHNHQSTINGESGNIMSTRKSVRNSLRSRSGQKKIGQTLRPQSLKERDALIKICRARNQFEKIRQVRCNWQSKEMMLREGDLVWIKTHQSDGWCVCDNAVSIGLVPVEILLPVDILQQSNLMRNNESTTSSTTPTVSTNIKRQISEQFDLLNSLSSQNTPPTEASKSDKEKDLIDLEENLIDFNSPPMPTPSSTGGQKTRTEIVDLFASIKEDQQKMEQKTDQNLDDPFEQLFQSALSVTDSSNSLPAPEIPNRPMFAETFSNSIQPNKPNFAEFSSNTSSSISPANEFTSAFGSNYSGSSNSIQPVRIAPPPPNQKKRASNYQPIYSVPPALVDVGQQAPAAVTAYYSMPPSTYSLPPSDSSAHSQQHFSTFAICIFPFEPDPNKPGQLPVQQGDKVEILQRHDHAGNSQWWMVRRVRDGANGFVPASYLSMNNTRV